MASLGVLTAAQNICGTNTPAIGGRKPKRPRAEPTEPTRRSGRLVGKEAENDGAAVDALGDSDDEEDRVAQARDILAHSRAWLEASRAALARHGDGVVAGGADGAWRTEAVRRWGPSVVAALPEGARCGSWQGRGHAVCYATHRA